MGWVGSSIAISVLHRGFSNELLINDVNGDVAEGEAMDFIHGSSFFPSTSIRACSIAEMKNCSIIVITAGRGGKPGETRLDLFHDNIQIAKHISSQLGGFEGLLVIVSNPVDVLTYFYQKFTAIPASKVIGTGTMLDTSRLRTMIGQKINVDPRSIHANVIGEHGDSEVVLWSRVLIGDLPIRKWRSWKTEYEEEITHQVRTAAYEIIKRKGATNHAIGLVTANLLDWLLRGERRIVNVSSVLTGYYGLDDVALSVPTLIDGDGVVEIQEYDISKDELEMLSKSAAVIKKAINDFSY